MGFKLKAGIVFGVIVVVWMLITGFAGIYKNPSLNSWVFPLGATVITVAVLIWALRQTAREGKRYGGQFVTALVVGLIGGVIIISGSLLFTTVLFPDYADLSLATAAEQLENQGKSQEEIEITMKGVEIMLSPVAQAVLGFIMTMIVVVVAGLIIAAFVRQK